MESPKIPDEASPSSSSSAISVRHQRLDVAPTPSSILLITANAKKTFSAPNIISVGPSDVLSRVKNFLPQMAAGHEALQQRLEQNPEEAERINIENIDDCKDGKVIEMNIALVEGMGEDEDTQEHEDDGSSSWSEDSEPDSPASPPRPGCHNDFTSDSDSDSTMSTSSGSSSDDGKKGEKPSTSKAKETTKRSLVQEMAADNLKKKPRSGMM